MSGCTILRPGHYPEGHRKIILTFDDGPAPTVTPAVLDVLQRHQVPATFCWIGESMKRHPELVQRALGEGHEIVNHTFTHTSAALFGADTLIREVIAFDALLAEITTPAPYRPRRFRPPLGLKTPAVRQAVAEHGFAYAYVTFYIDDARRGPEQAAAFLEKLKAELVEKNGGAIIIHERRYKADRPDAVDKSWVPSAVDELIVWAKAEGFLFVPYPSPPDEAAGLDKCSGVSHLGAEKR